MRERLISCSKNYHMLSSSNRKLIKGGKNDNGNNSSNAMNGYINSNGRACPPPVEDLMGNN